MKNFATWVILTFFYAFTVSGQTILPISGYFHLIGRINNNTPATIELIKSNDSLYADFRCDLSQLYHGDPIDQPDHLMLSGNMGPNGTFRLQEALSEKQGILFKGKIESSLNVKGTIQNVQGHEFPFEFSEKYPAGSVQFNLYTDSEVRKLVKKQHAPEASIGLAVLFPAESANALRSDTLSSIIQSCFFGKSDAEATPEEFLQGMKDIFFENYTNSNESLYEEMPEGRNYNWEMLKYMHIINNSDELLTFYIINYGFTGGAHGLETHDYYSADLRSGKLLKIKDILHPDSLPALTVLLTKKLRQINGLNGTQKLTEAGYFKEEISPNENFYVTSGGIGFFYNHYDIAPYSFGMTDLFLTFDELKGLLR